MEKEVVATKTIKAIGMQAYMLECKQAMKEGYDVLGNPEVTGNTYTQIVVKYKEVEAYK
jgi:hypothetical protein